MEVQQITAPVRRFLPNEIRIDSWETIEKYFKDLTERNISSLEDFKKWLLDKSELEAVLS